MKKTSRMRRFMRPRGRLQRALRVAGLALVLLPEPVTTPIGIALMGLSFAAPPDRRRALVHCGASIRRGHLSSYGTDSTRVPLFPYEIKGVERLKEVERRLFSSAS